MEVAETIFNELKRIKRETGVSFAFQGCEHINRAITIEREDYNPFTMEEVTVVRMFMQEEVLLHMPINI